ncbi:hypothetical protein QZM22_29130 [Burkholderia oklahomensis]|uniref:hypothetical protein n=1 Tax=Burkholderia oklahomensis TaxID=342113 RepID=UPI002651561C|nr:hypothetical protein [Burkholderia oklahomensis]MDN7676444.1 hypothetical protein [Burkholderia oklahomensis]
MNTIPRKHLHFMLSKHNESTKKTLNSGKKYRTRFRPNALIVAMSISGLLFGYENEAIAELTATSSEPTPASDQGSLASGFNAAVTEARSLDFVNNYTALYNANQQRWSQDKLPDNVTLACPAPTTTNPTISPGYLAGLWDRCAYYSRDYVHHAIGAYYLGYYDQNYTMADKLATLSFSNPPLNVPYWAISVEGKGYEKGDEMPAVFEIGENIANMYRLTADSRYLGQHFTNYFSRVTDYINVSNKTFLNSDQFRMARTQNSETASYNEKLYDSPVISTKTCDGPDSALAQNKKLLLGGDTAASQIAYYRALSYLYPSTTTYSDKYTALQNNFNSNWYVPNKNHFYVGLTGDSGTDYTSANYTSLTYANLYIREPNILPLYKGIITDKTKAQKQAQYINCKEEQTYAANNSNLGSPGIEYHTYLPSAFYNADERDMAWKWLTRLAKWQTTHRKTDSQGNTIGYNAYPEVSFVLISDTITKVLGLDYDAPNSVLSTKSGLPSTFGNNNFVTVSDIPIYNSAKNNGNGVTINVNVTQKINSSGANETDIGFATDLSKVAFNQGFHWAPKFYNPNGKKQCVLTTNGSNTPQYLNLVTDAATKISTCVDSSNIGIWVYTGPGANVSSMSVSLAP